MKEVIHNSENCRKCCLTCDALEDSLEGRRLLTEWIKDAVQINDAELFERTSKFLEDGIKK